jgi:hypothetical protein
MAAQQLERYCEIIAAMKVRPTNKKGRHMSTARVIELLEGEGVGWSRLPPACWTARR